MLVGALHLLAAASSGYTERPVELGVGWAATMAAHATAVLEWARVGPRDVFFELGCGDGTVAIEAAKRGAQVVCVEGDPAMLKRAQAAVQEAGLSSFIEIRLQDLMATDLVNATIVYFFLLPTMNAKLIPAIERMPDGARVIARDSEMYGWPCGTRFRWPDGLERELYVKWTLPVLRELSWRPERAHPSNEHDVIDHMLNCSAVDAIPDPVDERQIRSGDDVQFAEHTEL